VASPLPSPPVLPAESLRSKALEACRKHIEATLDGEYDLEPLEPFLAWSPLDLRVQHDQPIVVWRAYGAFEVLLDETHRSVGFVDHDKWLSCTYADLLPGEAEALARGTGLMPPGLVLVGEERGEKDCLELRFADTERVVRLLVRLNPDRKAVISVEPVATAL
jgi:hypothetical protein